MGNQTYSQWAAEKKRERLSLREKQKKQTSQLSSESIVSTLVCQHQLVLDTVSQRHEDMVRLISNHTVLMIKGTFAYKIGHLCTN